jgi:uncharacterized protein YndB with AHSA1/START domain
MPDIHHELYIAATAEEVYHALTHQTALSAWWTPGAKGISETYAVLRFYFGDDYFKEMKIMELKPAEYVEWLCIAGAEEWLDTTISFRLEPGSKEYLATKHQEITDQLNQSTQQNEGTLLMFRHDNWKEDSSMFAECNYTWGRFLSSLKLYCETGTGMLWPTQHQQK